MRTLRWLACIAVIIAMGLAPLETMASEVKPLEVNFSVANKVPVSKVEALALDEAQDVWGVATEGTMIPLCDLRGTVLAYEVVLHLSQSPFPTDADIRKGIQRGKDRQASVKRSEDRRSFEKASEMRWGVGEYATMIIGARYDVNPLLEYHTGLPPYYTVLEEAKAKASAYLGIAEPELKRIYAAGRLDKWFEFRGRERSVLVNVYSLKAYEPEEILASAALEKVHLRKQHEEEWREVWEYRLAHIRPRGSAKAAKTTGTTEKKIYGVLHMQWEEGCTPTAAAMILEYWDWKSGDVYDLVDY